jgi:hypothetical protein
MVTVLRPRDVEQTDEDWRIKLDELWRRFQVDRNPETKIEFGRALKQFGDLVYSGKL